MWSSSPATGADESVPATNGPAVVMGIEMGAIPGKSKVSGTNGTAGCGARSSDEGPF